MNPENQNNNPYNQQPSAPPQGYAVPPYYQTPQTYVPAPEYQGQPAPQVINTTIPNENKNSKKLVVAVVVFAVLLIGVIALAVLMNLQKSPPSVVTNKISMQYDSPSGLVPGLQSQAVGSGKFKLRASYVTGGDFVREGAFMVEDGKIYFDIVKDDARVNELMQYLYERKGSDGVFDVTKHGVSRYASFDFASILGFRYLVDDQVGELSGFIPHVDAEKLKSTPDPRYSLTTTCDESLANIKKYITMTTTGLSFDTKNIGVNKQESVINFATMQATDKSVLSFFDNCYNLNHPENETLKKFVDAKRDIVTKSPKFTYWQSDGINYLDISAPEKDVPFGGELHFELTELNKTTIEREGLVGSYVDRRNQFGLAYSVCRVDPVVTTSSSEIYRFVREDPEYKLPDISDNGYYCRTMDVPPQYSPPKTLSLKTSTGTLQAANSSEVDNIRGFHDLVYELEKFGIKNKRFPGPTEFRDMATSNMDNLTETTKNSYNSKLLAYVPLPADCVGTCNDYSLSLNAANNVQLQRTTYKPEISSEIPPKPANQN